MIRQPETKSEVARAALELVHDAVLVVDVLSQRIVDVNRAACELLARTHEQLIDRPWRDFEPSLSNSTLTDLHGCMIVVAHGGAAGPSAPSPAFRDALTGLAGRGALAAHESNGKRRDSRGRRALLFIDLDGFKRVNDTWGHTVGDQVLCTIAQRLAESVRPRDLVVRYGGDEFLVLVEGVSRRRDVERLARRIMRAVERPLHVCNREIVLSASIGIAEHRNGSLEALIVEADRAMYHAKANRQREPLGTAIDRRAPEKPFDRLGSQHW
jgi:diguanylate cyclase (GGDEF)-like protein